MVNPKWDGGSFDFRPPVTVPEDVASALYRIHGGKKRASEKTLVEMLTRDTANTCINWGAIDAELGGQILELDDLEVSAQVFSEDVRQLRDLEDIAFENSGHRYATKLRTILPSINTRTRNREVRLLFVDGPALPGAAGKILWTDPRPHLPGRLLVKRGEALGFFVAEQGLARFIAVPDAEVGRAAPVALSPDTQIIVERYLGLRDGTAITNSSAP